MPDYSDADETADKIGDIGEIGDIGTTAVEAAGGELGGPVGMVAAAGVGGYEFGRKLDKMTGASDKISDAMPGGQEYSAANQSVVDDGVTPMTGQKWQDEKVKVDTQQAITNGSPMHPDQAAYEKYRLNNGVPWGDDPQAAMNTVCEPYAH